MLILITGASSGIGRDMARYLSGKGHKLVLVARRRDRLEELASELGNCEIIETDLSIKENCIKLYESLKDRNIDVLINNAGFGLFGSFTETPLERELDLIKTNITAVHILTKLFLKDFSAKNNGYILNVASIAGFFPGPLLSSYYASKAYVLRLTLALNEEMRREHKNVHLSALCPGPVKTEFDDVAGVRFSIKGLSSEYVAKYAIDKMFAGKTIIVPGFMTKAAVFFRHFVSEKFLAKITYNMQKRKRR
ncbi:MAG: SDR family oxidoreductase [Ruminococcaceae bacterium]|jgi:hypothetical protein|nr:SDR family oxidoreductase [Oscillospiraceae bacterium]